MANLNFKGRPVGSGKNTFIEDPLMGDYKITIDEYSYNVFDTVKNKTVGFHTTLEQAILSIARKLMLQEKTYSLEEFATEFQQTHLNLKEAILKWAVQEHQDLGEGRVDNTDLLN